MSNKESGLYSDRKGTSQVMSSLCKRDSDFGHSKLFQPDLFSFSLREAKQKLIWTSVVSIFIKASILDWLMESQGRSK